MTYTVVENDSVKILITSVQKLRAKGWDPVGGITSVSRITDVPPPQGLQDAALYQESLAARHMDLVQSEGLRERYRTVTTFYQAMIPSKS